MKKNLRFLMLTLLCAVFSTAWGLNDYSNVYSSDEGLLSTTGGDNLTNCSVVIDNNTYPAIKGGTSKSQGIWKVTVPQGTKYLHIHVAAWNKDGGQLTVSQGSPSSISLTSDTGISGNGSTFTLAGSPDEDYYKVITFENPLSQATQITFTGTNNKRFVVFGVKAEIDNTPIPTISVDETNIELTASGGTGSITVDYTLVDPEDAEVRSYASNGTTTASYDWIQAELNGDGNISYTVQENTGAANRTAYLKVYGLDGSSNDVYSQLITITQKKPVLDYAILPFTFTGGSSDIEGTEGLTHSGLESYTSGDLKLKFDTQGDNLVLKINEVPGILSFDIKGNPGSGTFSGTMTIETSVNGTDYTESTVLTASEISSTKTTITINDLPRTARYIRWYFTERSNGNIALGNINLLRFVETITVENAPFEFDSEDHNGTIDVSYNGFVPSSTDVYFYESDGTTSASYDWITVDFDNDNNITYQINENNGNAARTAYFKVYALDDDANEVYSALIAITQNKHVVDYAVLPFAFNEGNSAIESTEGLSQSGLGTSDYGTATTKLKFDNDGDNVILHFNEEPGILTFDVKANGSGSTFTSTMTLTASADGTTYSYSKELSSDDIVGTEETNTITITNLPATARYIKWEMNKETGNIGMGNIHLYRPTVVFTDDGEDNTDIISANEGLANVMLGGRTLVKGGSWNTLCLPFNVDLNDEDGVLFGATAKTLTDATMTGTHVTLNFGSNVSELVAGTPYIIKWDSGDNIVDPLFMNVNIVEAEPATINKADGCVQFKGYYDAFDITAENHSNIYYMTAGSKLKHTGKDRTLNAFRAYFVFTAEAEALEFTMDFGDGTTVIQGAELNLDTESGAWYTIDGRRLNAEPTAKGVYIHNGQKMIIK